MVFVINIIKIFYQKKYDLFQKYIDLILCQRNNWFSKIHLIDIGKKLIIFKNLNEIDELMFYFYKYINVNKIKAIQDYYNMYDYYELPVPNYLGLIIVSKIIYFYNYIL